MQLGLPTDITWYKLLTDWGSLIGGGVALIAGLIAYLAGLSQAGATREAAMTQIEAERHRYNLDVDTLRKSVALEMRQIVMQAYAAYNSLSKIVARADGKITARMLESSVGIPSPIVYPAVADRISLLRDEAMDVIIVYRLVEIARESTRKLINSRETDDISRVNVAAVAEAFLISCSYSKGLLPRLTTGIADHDKKDEGVIKNITDAQASWNAIKAGLYKNSVD